MDSPYKILQEVLEVSQLFIQERNMEKQLQIIASAARKLTSASSAAIYLLDETNRYLVPTVKQGPLLSHSSVNLDPVELTSGKKPHLPDLTAFCALSGRQVFVADIYQYSGYFFESWYSWDKEVNCKTGSVHAIPLTDRESRSVGVMLLVDRESSQKEQVIPEEMETMLGGFAALAAISITNSKLLNQNEDLLKQQTLLNTTLIDENKELKGRLFNTITIDKVIGQSHAMKRVFSLIEKVSSANANVFIHGETGTGKELIAATIHENSPVKTGQFIAQNCAAFPPDLLESEMFGYKKGAFSGATANKKGLFEAAHNGSIFLDEIGEMPLSLQAKLLRVLQEGEIRPVGSVECLKVNVRVIAATNKDLAQMVKEGTFREDLFYRLNVFPITLPPLRDREEDIPILLNYFLDKYCKQYDKQILQIEPRVMDFFQHYNFPGNVRELQNIVERAVIMAGKNNVFGYDSLPDELQDVYEQKSLDTQHIGEYDSLRDAVEAFEAKYIRKELNRNSGNQTHTAQQLGLSRRTLVEKLGKYNLRRMDTNPY